jgi:putative ABC transport system permease protein
MLRVTLKNLFARKFRLVLTSLAVVLGVAFMSGTFVLTDTIGNVFDDLFADVNRGVDVAVRSKPAFDETAGGPGSQEVRQPIPESLLGVVEQVPGVRAAQGNVQGYALVAELKADGTPGDPVAHQAPSIGVSWGKDRQLSQAFGGDGRPEAGHRPVAPNEVAIDESTAAEVGITGADVRRCARGGGCRDSRVQVVFLQHPAGQYDVVGVFKFGTVGNLAGATLAAFDTPTAQEVMNRTGQFDQIIIAADDGVSQVELRARVRTALRQAGDAGYEVLTGEQLAQDTSDQIRSNLNFFSTFLLIFALVALFVGAFIIYNTFTIIVAQRARELGLLRALGASGRQVMGSVALEALAVGLLSSVLGLVLGILVAIGLENLMRAIGFDLPAGDPVIAMRTIVASVVVGTAVTAVSAIAPARRAAKVPPIAALRSDVTLAGTAGRRTVWGVLFGGVGAALMITGLFVGADWFPGGTAAAVGVGAALVFVGAAMLSPLLAVPTGRVIGWLPARVRGMSGRLARENAIRNPRRTASTAAALMIGLALVSVVAILGASVKQTLSDVLQNDFKAEFSLTTTGFAPLPVEAAQAVRDVLPRAAVTEFRFGQFESDGATDTLLGVDQNLARTIDVHPVGDALTRWRRDGGLLLFSDTYDALPAATRRAGELQIRFPGQPRGETTSVPIAGVFTEKGALGNEYLLAMPEYERVYTDQADVFVSVKLPPGLGFERGRRVIDRALKPYPNVDAKDQGEFQAQQEASIDQFLNLMYVLLLLAVIIALIGIVNTLALSVFERTRELGLLRAVGMTRPQLRSMIRYEAVIISVFGSLLGLVLGITFGLAMVAALESEGIKLGFPVTQLVVFLVLSALAGLFAGVFPARRAARLDVLEAIGNE